MAESVRMSATADIDPGTLYRILALRSQVFVVEQECAYLDLDGRDLEPGAVQVWVEDDGAVLATLRVLDDGDLARVGRVATDAEARGRGLAARLMAAALTMVEGRAVVLDAQAHLAGWYERFGFAVAGEKFDEDGIAHVPMRREAE